ncbi:transcription factor bHLH60-like [Cornus florida]|uniref:transcription factor bHLH60-like n=1 Tax=Cornus florida TaxID=4283 RepID=UPI00289DB25F|nr:transcription factor bHLH60-like [Cornus florida]
MGGPSLINRPFLCTGRTELQFCFSVERLMKGLESAEVRSGEIGVESFQFGEEIQRLMSTPLEVGSSFTALLELPTNQAMSLLHSPQSDDTPAKLSGGVWNNHHNPYHIQSLNCTLTFPSNTALKKKKNDWVITALLDRASKFSVFAATVNSLETSSIPSNSSGNSYKVKPEPFDSDSNPDSSPMVSDPTVSNKNKNQQNQQC